MHPRRVAAFLLGAWLACSFSFSLAAIESTSGADQTIEKPTKAAQQAIAQLGPDQSRGLLQNAAAISRATLLSESEIAQFGIAVLAAACVIGERATRILLGPLMVMLILAVFQHFFVTPEFAWLGQELAFAPEGSAIAQRDRLSNFQHIYAFTESAKLLLGLVAAVALFLMRRGGPHRRHRPEMEDEIIERRAAL